MSCTSFLRIHVAQDACAGNNLRAVLVSKGTVSELCESEGFCIEGGGKARYGDRRKRMYGSALANGCVHGAGTEKVNRKLRITA